MNTIAIDCGASFIKGALIDDNGVIVAKCQKSAPSVHSEQTILEPVQINALFLMVEEMIEELANNKTRVKLCISNEMHGFLLTLEDGIPYTDYISWQKEYGSIKINGESSIDILSSKEYSKDVWISGMSLRKGLPSCNLLYLRRAGCLENAKSKLYFYTLGDYIIRRFANIQPVCHPSNMAATGLYDLEKNMWNTRFIHKICGNDIVFPQTISGGNKCIIDVDKNGKRYYIYPAIGDQQAALLGAGLDSGNTLSFNLGTGAQVSTLIKKVDLGVGYQIRPYFRGEYIKTIPHLPSGRALNVYVRFFEDIFKQFGILKNRDDIWKVLLAVSNQTDSSNLICDMSFFENPVTNCNVGSITNIGEHDLYVGTLLNGIFEQMVKNFIWAADKIQPNREIIEKIIFSGGVARKIKKIRNGIAACYLNNVEINVALDETLMGLFKYGNGVSV